MQLLLEKTENGSAEHAETKRSLLLKTFYREGPKFNNRANTLCGANFGTIEKEREREARDDLPLKVHSNQRNAQLANKVLFMPRLAKPSPLTGNPFLRCCLCTTKQEDHFPLLYDARSRLCSVVRPSVGDG